MTARAPHYADHAAHVGNSGHTIAHEAHPNSRHTAAVVERSAQGLTSSTANIVSLIQTGDSILESTQVAEADNQETGSEVANSPATPEVEEMHMAWCGFAETVLLIS